MLRRLSLHIRLILLALALVIVPGALVIVSQSRWAHHRLQEIIARQLAETVKREVYVGPISGNVLRGITARGLAIAEGQRLADGAIITAERVRVRYDLASVLRGRLVPAASVRTVELWNPRLHVVRERSGRVNLQRLLPPPRRVPPEKRFRGTVLLYNASVFYEDYWPRLARPPLQLHLTAPRFVADVTRVTRIAASLQATVHDPYADSLGVRATFDTDSPFVDVSGRIENLDVSWLARTIGPVPGYGVSGGRADLRGSLYRVVGRGRPAFDYSLAASLRGVSVRVPRQPQPVGLEGTLWAGRAGARFSDLRVAAAGSRFLVKGWLTRPAAPTVDLSVASEAVRLERLAELVPRGAASKALPRAQGEVAANAAVVGPLANPDLRVRVQGTPRPVRLSRPDWGSASARNLFVSADITSARSHPLVRATVRGNDLTVPALRPSGASWPRTVSVAPTGPFSVSLQSCGARPVAQAELRLPALRAEALRVTDLRTRATLVGDTVRLQNLQARALGGRLQADGAVFTARGHPGLRLRGSVRGVDLARLGELPITPPRGLAGTADLGFQAEVTPQHTAAIANVAARDLRTAEGSAARLTATLAAEHTSRWRGAARVALSDVSHGRGELRRARALLELDDRVLTVREAFAEGPAGVAWASGEVDLADRQLALQVAGAELSLPVLSQVARLKEQVQGIGYAAGTVSGPLDGPGFDGRLVVFRPRLRDYSLDALTAKVHLEGDTLQARDLLASRGSATFSGEGSVSNLSSPAEQMALRGQFEGQGLRLAEVGRLAGRQWPADGLAEFTATVAGTVASPEARGEIRIANAHYENLPIARAVLPFVLDEQRLTVAGAEGLVLDSPFSGRFVLNFTRPTEIEGELSTAQVRLEGLSPFWGSGVRLGGEANLSDIWVRGPTDNLQGGAHLSAREINVGGEIIRNVDAHVTLAKGLVQLEQTKFDAAGGEVALKAGYDYAATPRTMTAQIALRGTGLPGLLYLAIPVAQAVDRRPAAAQAERRLALRSYALRTRGTLNGTVNLTGPVDKPVAVTELKAADLVLDGRSLPDLEGHGTVSAAGIEDLSVAAHQGEAVLTADGDVLFDGAVNATIEGSAVNLAELRPWMPFSIPFGGRLDFTVVASGQTRRPELTASVDVTNPVFAGVGFDILTVPVATLREGQISVDTLIIKRGQQQVVVDGQLPFSWNVASAGGRGEGRPGLIPNGQIELGGHIDRTDLAFFLPLIDEYLRARRTSSEEQSSPFSWASVVAEGKVDSSVTVRGTVAEPTLRGFLRVENGSLKPKSWPQPLSDLQADVALLGSASGNLLQIDTLTAAYDQTRAEADGRVYLDHLKLADFWRNRFDVSARVKAAKQGVAGGVQLADVDGGVSLRTNGAGEQVVRAEDLHARVGEARATLTGDAVLTNLTLDDLASNRFALDLSVKPGRMRIANAVDATVGGQLQLVTPAGQDRAVLRGKWEVSEGVVGAASAGLSAAHTYAARSTLPKPALDLQLAIGKNVKFRTSGISTALEPNAQALTLRGTPQAPEARGSVVARGGTTSLPGGTMRLTYFRANYLLRPLPGDLRDPVELQPVTTVEGVAESTINRPGDTPIVITVNIRGTLPDVQVVTSSNPPLTETQIYALLGGVPFSHLAGVSGRDPNMTQMVSDQFLATLANAFRVRVFEPLEEEIKRALGLSQLGITFAYDQPVSVQVGKYVLRNLLVSYERPLGGVDSDQYDLRVSYELPGGLRITYHEDETNDQRLEVGHNFTF